MEEKEEIKQTAILVAEVLDKLQALRKTKVYLLKTIECIKSIEEQILAELKLNNDSKLIKSLNDFEASFSQTCSNVINESNFATFARGGKINKINISPNMIWHNFKHKKPLAYMSGVWAGKKSEEILVCTTDKRYYIAEMYEGIVNDCEFCIFHDYHNDFEIKDVAFWAEIIAPSYFQE